MVYERDMIVDVLNHGFKILADNNLQCFGGTAEIAEYYGVDMLGVNPYSQGFNPSLEWNDYVLKFEGKIYHGKFDSHEDWQASYS